MEDDWSPLLDTGEPAAEHVHARHISNQLSGLKSHEDQFASAVALFDHVEALISNNRSAGGNVRERAAMANWMDISANHAALTVYHFQSTLRSIRDQIQYAPTLAAKVDSRKIEAAYNRFPLEFPVWKEVRDWVGHFADKMFKPADIENNLTPDGLLFHGTLIGRSLVFTRKGEFIQLDVTEENRQRLRAVKNDAYSAFQKASLWPPDD